MKLAEALQASTHRKAYGYLRNGGPHGLPVAIAMDAGVELIVIDTNLGPILELRKSWAELLPAEREQIENGLDWEPVDPKHPLIQLGDAITDWSDDDAED